MASRSRSPSRDRYRSPRSLSPKSDRSRSPTRRRSYDSRSPSRSRSPSPRRNGRYRSESRSRSRGRSASPTVRSTKIVVERLTKNINEGHLEEIFGQYGPIKDLDLPINRTYGTNRGTAYILYEHEADAEEAIAHMHEAQIDGAVINVSIVLPRRKLSPPPPMARRGAGYDPRLPAPGGRAVLVAADRLRLAGLAPDQTPTARGLFRGLPLDHQWPRRRLEVVVEAGSGAGRDHTRDLARHPRDVLEVDGPMTDEGAKAETATVVTTVVDLLPLAVTAAGVGTWFTYAENDI
ncbi:RNA-binding protein with serine-rich domain 1 [Colletotrichum orbiculare MAFF 240422]|uniref:RNA-binding protein with serine-rich domain 1 n=1 Tax=Colletotrichum orbiculare (strain 104-T / ATCC 96160 / CBS 514.97 / LARS 414 / MAFF 240422) TaxID=1213857 RepID=A0A484FP33_COLOR|nr:RNA-binding protein with serine-rich domain 1 [Colletotrichum orbiculare MAFF 240422]